MARPVPSSRAQRPIQRQGPPALGRSEATTSLPKGKVEHLLRGGGEPGSVPTSKSPLRAGGKPTRKGARTARARLRPLFRRAGWAQAAANSRHRPEPGARPERGAGCGAAACPAPLARARPPARPPCPATTTSSWRSLSGGCFARCAGSPCASLCRFLPAATASATPACRSSSGASRGWQGRPVRGVDTAWGGAQVGGMPGLCLRRGPVTSGAPTVTSRGGGDVRPRGRTPLTNL